MMRGTQSPSLHTNAGFRRLHMPSKGIEHIELYSFLWFFIGAVLNVYSYGTLAPVVVTVLVFIGTIVLLALTPLGGAAEGRMFRSVFGTGFAMAGIAAVYANQFQDQSQLFSDAGSFFNMATGQAANISLAELKLIHEGSLGIILWQSVYDFFSAMGFEKGRYIGVAVNVTCVALTGVLGIKMLRQVYGNDDARFRRLTVLVSYCGLFWLFAAIHIRDSIVLLAIAALACVWQSYLAKPTLGPRFMWVISANLLAGVFFGYLRTEFSFVPVAMTVAAVASLYLGRLDRRRRVALYGLLLVGGIGSVVLAMTYSEGLLAALRGGNLGYREHGVLQHGEGSLGMALIVNQPLLIRIPLGSAYLFLFPIPFWSGFFEGTAYNLFKSLNVIYFYFILPLVVIGARRLLLDRVPMLMFQLLLSIGFTMAVAASSLETRHFGAFLMPILILACIPDPNDIQIKRLYRNYLALVLMAICALHVAWVILKGF